MSGNRFRCVWWQGASSGRETPPTTTCSTPGCHIIKTLRRRVLSAFICTEDNSWRTSTTSVLFYLQKQFCIKLGWRWQSPRRKCCVHARRGIFGTRYIWLRVWNKKQCQNKINQESDSLINSILTIFSQIRLCFTTRLICYFYLVDKTQIIIRAFW